MAMRDYEGAEEHLPDTIVHPIEKFQPLSNEIDGFLGLALYMGSRADEMKGRFSRHYGERRILEIPYKNLTTESIVELAVERLHAVMQMQKKIKTDLIKEVRGKLDVLILDRERIKQYSA